VEYGPVVAGLVDVVRTAFPGRPVELEGEGQLSSAFRVDQELIVRVPRHAFGVDRLRYEVDLLESIGELLSTATPEIVEVALDRPAGRAYVVHRRIPGQVMRREHLLGLTADRIDRIGRQIGRFLRELHSIDVETLPAVPVRTPADFAGQLGVEIHETLAPLIDPKQLDRLAGDLAALATVPDRPLVLAHTDIGGNVVVDEDDYVGIIDFGSCFGTHPAFDVASLSTLGGSLTEAAAVEYPSLTLYSEEAEAVARSFFLQDALYGARQEDWAYVRAMFLPSD
jgi:aminoglycoside phosphotransferase (APT) family kinase protein